MNNTNAWPTSTFRFANVAICFWVFGASQVLSAVGEDQTNMPGVAVAQAKPMPCAVLCPTNSQDMPAGMLGHPLGTYLTIEGVRAEPEAFNTAGLNPNTLLVTNVNGKQLSSPVPMAIENVVALPKATRCVLRGFESGQMAGLPPAYVEAAREEGHEPPVPPEIAIWHFHHRFMVMSVVEPIDLKTEH